MTTWKCHDCESQFYEPDTVLYRAGRCGNGSENWVNDEFISVCPSCGSEYFYEIEICEGCDDVFELGTLDENDLCPACAEQLEKELEMPAGVD